MKRDFVLYNEGQRLRKQGLSIRKIAHQLKISTSTASLWCRDIELSDDQKRILSLGRVNNEFLIRLGAKRHEEKLERHSKITEKARLDILRLSKNEFFIAGLSLYWAEGFKNVNEQRVGFCNSDPRMIKFMMSWFRNSLSIPDEDFTLRAEFNISHKDRLDEIEDYWSMLTGISRAQFNAPYFQKSAFLRDYSDRGPYFGVLRIRIRRSSELLVKIRAWIEALTLAF